MEPEKRPEVVDLRRYRAAREARKRQASPPSSGPPRRPGSEPLLGPRPRAGLILALVAAALAALWLVPALL